MCKIKKALISGDFETLSTMSININDIESLITDAEACIEDDKNLIEETNAWSSALKQRVERAQKRINEAEAIIENGNLLLEMMEKGDFFAGEE